MYHLKVDPEFIMPMKGQRAVFNSLQGQDCVDILRKLSQLLSNFYIGRTFQIALIAFNQFVDLFLGSLLLNIGYLAKKSGDNIFIFRVNTNS